MTKMFTMTVALILLAGCTDSREETVIADKPDESFKPHVQDLESDDVNVRRKAFDCLAGQGDRGLEAIKDFCKRHTDNGWGKEEDGFRCRISADPILYYERGGFEPHFKGNVIKGNIKVELQNVSTNTLSIFTHGGEILVDPHHYVKIEPYVGKMPEDWGLLIRAVVPEDLIHISKNETITEYDWVCNEARCFIVEDKVVSFRHYLSMDKGIYYISYDLTLFSGPQYSGPSGEVTSNRVCIALLPARKKQ